MPLHPGTIAIDGAKLGSTGVAGIYLGTQELWVVPHSGGGSLDIDAQRYIEAVNAVRGTALTSSAAAAIDGLVRTLKGRQTPRRPPAA